MDIMKIVKKCIWIVLVIGIVIVALFHKYEYRCIHTQGILCDREYGGTYVEGTYEDAVIKINGTVQSGTLRCVYFYSENEPDWYNVEHLVTIEKNYEAGDVVEEEILLGTLNVGWQCIGMEKLGTEELTQDVEIIIEARQYGYQILEEFIKSRLPK